MCKYVHLYCQYNSLYTCMMIMLLHARVMIFPVNVRTDKTKPNVRHMNTYTLLASESFATRLWRLRQCICRSRPTSMQRIVPDSISYCRNSQCCITFSKGHVSHVSPSLEAIKFWHSYTIINFFINILLCFNQYVPIKDTNWVHWNISAQDISLLCKFQYNCYIHL